MAVVAPAREVDGRRLTYAPGLDGVRGLAVLAVLVFHAGPAGWLPGGFLGVSLFFTLSGYLIASLVIAEVESTGGVDLGRFWARRVRRLIPALLLTVAGVAALAHLIDLPDRTRTELIGGLTYSANWVQLASGQSYAELFQTPSALTHLWSLAIEEQFYVVFPLLAWVVARRRPERIRAVLGIGAATAFASGLVTAWIVHDAAFGYYSTPTRVPEIAAGIALAAVTRGVARSDPPNSSASGAPSRTLALENGLGVVGLGATVWAWRVTAVSDGWVGRGGLALFALASTALVAGTARPGPLATALGVEPLRFLGKISYGLYLYHWPVVVVLSHPRVDWAPVPLFAARVGASLALAVVSYLVIEQPIRSGWIAHRTALGRARPALRAGLGSLAIGVVAVMLAVPADPGGGLDEVATRPAPAVVRPGDIADNRSGDGSDGSSTVTGPEGDRGGGGGQPGGSTEPVVPPGPPVVVLLGDSVPNWLVRDGGHGLDPSEVTLVDATSEGCDGAEGSPTGRAGTGVVVTLPETCTGWRSQYPPVMTAGPVDVAVLMIGTGAVLDRQLEGTFHGPCDDEAREWYGDDVRARLEYLADHAGDVVLVLPAWAEDWSGWVNPPDHRARTDCVRATLRAQAAAVQGVEVVDLGAELCPDGPEACRPVRERDGVHIDPDDAPEVLRWIVDRAVA